MADLSNESRSAGHTGPSTKATTSLVHASLTRLIVDTLFSNTGVSASTIVNVQPIWKALRTVIVTFGPSVIVAKVWVHYLDTRHTTRILPRLEGCETTWGLLSALAKFVGKNSADLQANQR